jgi:hypothetical protein
MLIVIILTQDTTKTHNTFDLNKDRRRECQHDINVAM